MSVPDDFRDPGTLVVVTALGENPLAGSVFEKQAIHEGDQQWQNDHQAILQRVNSATGSVRLVDAEELPTFFTSIRLAPLTILVALAFGVYGPIQTELLKLRVSTNNFDKLESENCSEFWKINTVIIMAHFIDQ